MITISISRNRKEIIYDPFHGCNSHSSHACLFYGLSVLCRRTHQMIVNHCIERHRAFFVHLWKNTNNKSMRIYYAMLFFQVFIRFHSAERIFSNMVRMIKLICTIYTICKQDIVQSKQIFQWISMFHLGDISLVVDCVFFGYVSWVYGFLVFQKSLPSYWRQ